MPVAYRRFASAAGSLALALVTLAVVATPADAAVAPPWRWKEASLAQGVPGNTTAGFEVQCPAGYIPVSGGMSGGSNVLYIRREYPDYNTNRYVMVITNSGASLITVTVKTWCANASDVGPIDTHTETFPEVNNRAGGAATCPDGTTLLSGGVDWGSTGDRHIDFSGPTPLADGWFAAGTSAAAGDTLYIEVRCIASSTVPDWTIATSFADVPGTANSSRNVLCPAGRRALTGGTWAGPSGTNQRDTVARGHTYWSQPGDRGWSGSAQVTNSRFTVVAICIPVSTPTVAFTNTPPELTNSTSGSFTFSASDPAGEELTYACQVDLATIPCTPGSPVTFGPLSDGDHSLFAVADNTSHQFDSVQYQFTIDTTAPTVANREPLSVAGLLDDFEAEFSEPVSGVNASSLRVYADGSTTPLNGQVSVAPTAGAATSATFDPQAPLLPGQSYTVQLGSSIKDAAGNPLTPPDWEVRAQPQVDDVEAAVKQSWDSDKSAKASGGRYIASRTKGSSAGLFVVVPASGEVSLFGMRMPSGGYGQVYLDGVRKRKVSFYARGDTRARVYRATGLSPGSRHHLEVRVPGTKPSASSGSWVALDSVVLGAKVKQESAFTQGFRRVTDAAAYGGSYTTVDHATRGDNGGKPEFRLRFRGTSISVHAVLGPDAGKAAIYVDGVFRKTVDLKASGRAYDVEVFSRSLTDKIHEIRVVPVGTRTGARSVIGIDRFVIG